jgi:hypothetical protein
MKNKNIKRCQKNDKCGAFSNGEAIYSKVNKK